MKESNSSCYPCLIISSNQTKAMFDAIYYLPSVSLQLRPPIVKCNATRFFVQKTQIANPGIRGNGLQTFMSSQFDKQQASKHVANSLAMDSCNFTYYVAQVVILTSVYTQVSVFTAQTNFAQF